MRRASRTAVTCAVAGMLAQACAGGAMQSVSDGSAAQSPPSYGIYGTDNYFKVEWQSHERRGKPVVSGYVTNQWGIGVKDVRLRVETLDAAGHVSATDIGYVFGDVMPGVRVYFEVSVPRSAANYRVSVLSFDASQCRG